MGLLGFGSEHAEADEVVCECDCEDEDKEDEDAVEGGTPGGVGRCEGQVCERLVGIWPKGGKKEETKTWA